MDNPLIAAINAADGASIAQLLISRPNLATLADGHGNTPLHHAAALRNTELMAALLRIGGADVAAKNHYGETAADWFRSYAMGTNEWNRYQDLDHLAQEIAEGNLSFVEEFWGVESTYSLRYRDGETPLHLAVRHGQLAIVTLMLNSVADHVVEQLLAVRNGQGETPLAVAATAQKSGSLAMQHIFEYLQHIQLKAIGGASKKQPQAFTNPPPLPVINPQIIINLAQQLDAGVTASDFPKLRPALPTLCQLSYLLCQQAAITLSNINGAELTKLQQEKRQSLLERLFGAPVDTTAIRQLQHQIADMATYLGGTIQQGRVMQLIELSDEFSHLIGWNQAAEDKIYLNLSLKADLLTVAMSLIHETSHKVNKSYDFVYCKHQFLVPRSLGLDFSGSYQLALTGKSPQLTAEKENILATQHLLEGQPQPFPQWLALNNADSIAAAVIGLAALRNDCATVDFAQNTLSIDARLLSPAYVTHYATTPEQPMPRPRLRAISLHRSPGHSPKDSTPVVPSPPGSPSTPSTAPTIASEKSNRRIRKLRCLTLCRKTRSDGEGDPTSRTLEDESNSPPFSAASVTSAASGGTGYDSRSPFSLNASPDAPSLRIGKLKEAVVAFRYSFPSNTGDYLQPASTREASSPGLYGLPGSSGLNRPGD